MSFMPKTDLQAAPDFCEFYFRTETTSGFIYRRVRLRTRKFGSFYQVEFKNVEAGIKDEPSWPQSDEFLDVALTVILIVEIYSERYPSRILRFFAKNKIESQLFSVVLGRFRFLLEKSFTIEWESHNTKWSGEGPSFRPCVIRRKPIPYFSIHTVESTWRGTSRIFNYEFNIELQKRVVVGCTIPADNEN